MINKRMKQESTSPTSRPAHLSNSREVDAPGMQDTHMPDHDHAALDLHAPFSDAPLVDKDANWQSGMTVGEKEAPLGPTSYASPPTFQTDTVDAKEINSAPVSKPTATLVSPPTSLADETDVPQEQADGEGDHVVVLHTPTSSSRHSSRQPRQVDRYMPETHVPKPTKGTTHTPTARRSSFGGSSGGVRKSTPGPSSGSKKSASRPSSSSHAKKSFWATDEKKGDRHAATSTSPGQPGKNSKRVADEEPDAESLRLIRELQEAEFGLRKRSTRV